jgi:5-methylcytosine-specific restriction protein A
MESTPPMYRVGELYSRSDIYRILRIPKSQQGGDWLNGYHRHGSDYYVFCNVGTAGRTGHDYENRFEGDRLIWFGKRTSTFAQESIKNLISGDYRVLVFVRDNDRSKFTFLGLGTAVPHYDSSSPVRIDWKIGPLKVVTP